MDPKKDTNISVNSANSKNIIVFRLFEKDNYLLFVYKKSERIVSAFYLVSNLLSDSEPIKWQFRNVGINIMSQTLSLTSKPLSKSEVIYKVVSELVRLLSLLDVSYVAGLVSNMNYTVLKKELENLLETLDASDFSRSGQSHKKVLLDKEFFTVPSDHLAPSADPKEDFLESVTRFPGQGLGSSGMPIRTWSDAAAFSSQAHRKGHNKGQKPIKDKILSLKNSPKGVSEEFADKVSTRRQTLILELLKTKNNLTIKDFILVVKNCSSKTIQRELLKLVERGVLKKEGQRRWSRYSLNLPPTHF